MSATPETPQTESSNAPQAGVAEQFQKFFGNLFFKKKATQDQITKIMTDFVQGMQAAGYYDVRALPIDFGGGVVNFRSHTAIEVQVADASWDAIYANLRNQYQEVVTNKHCVGQIGFND